MHVVPELERLEGRFARELTVVGVHSGKFTGEHGTAAVEMAARRYGLEHPIVNDAGSRIWRAYGVRAWPTLVLLDTQGRERARVAGEGHYDELERAIATLVAEAEKDGTLSRTPLDFLVPPKAEDGALAFPGKVLADVEAQRLFVADSNHHRVLEIGLDGKVRRVVGSGKAGTEDGPAGKASFAWPQGLAVQGARLLVADTGASTIRAVDLENWTVSTVAGTGRQEWLRRGGKALETSLNSPWDLTVVGDDVLIAMAGDHRLWLLEAKRGIVGPWAGSGREDIADGPFETAAFSQPSGVARDGDVVWVADSEDSAVRKVIPAARRVETIVGVGLFDFGDVDGKGDEVRLQHPLHVTPWRGKLLVADTYNHKIKLVDPADRSSRTLAGTGKPGLRDGPAAEARFDEPSGMSLLGDRLYVADTNNHRIRVVDLEKLTVATLPVE